jgi:uncharacterized membrane protein
MMNKQEYLTKLEKELKSAGVKDTGDIIDEYAAHFDLKTADGYGEEETAAGLGNPEIIAGQFNEINPNHGGKSVQKAVVAAGLVLTGLFAMPFYAFVYTWVLTAGTVAVACVTAGTVMITNIGVAAGVVRIPEMPYGCALLIGAALLALFVLSAVGTEYCRLYSNQLFKKYIRWHKTLWNGVADIMPPLPLHPVINPKKRRLMRTLTLISLPVFIVTFVTGLITMMLTAGSLEPWHVWGWFQ